MQSFTKQGLIDLYRASHESLDVLIDHAAAVPIELLTREIEGFGRGSVLRQLVHILSSETVWVCAIDGRPIRRLNSDDFHTIEDVRTARQRVMGSTLAYLLAADERDLNTVLARVPDQWAGPVRPPAYILLHVITHAFHHKGQIVAMLRLLGHPAPDTDLQRP